MISLLILYLLITNSACLVIKPVDVRRVDYCKLPCKQANREGKVVAMHENSACHCRRNPDYVEELDDFVEFRRYMLEQHNKLRNKIAGGLQEQVNDNYYPKASNMRAMSYSMEQEYIARCYAVKVYDYHDKCRRSTEWEHCGQNLAFNIQPFTHPYLYISAWWHEYDQYDPEWIKSFKASDAEKHAHFTQMSWALDYQMGCAKSFCPTKNKSSYQWAILCNYGGGFSNAAGRPVYLEGEPCSQCPNGTKCNKQYPNLCGEIDPVPEDPPVPIFLEGEEVPPDWNSTNLSSAGHVDVYYIKKLFFVVGVLYVV